MNTQNDYGCYLIRNRVSEKIYVGSGYNQNKLAAGGSSKPHSAEAKAKMRAARLGKKCSKSHKVAMSRAAKKRWHSYSEAEKQSAISKSGIAKKHSKATKEKIRLSHLGTQYGEETKAKIRSNNQKRIKLHSGVRFVASRGKYVAQPSIGGTQFFLGYFRDEDSAIVAVNNFKTDLSACL